MSVNKRVTNRKRMVNRGERMPIFQPKKNDLTVYTGAQGFVDGQCLFTIIGTSNRVAEALEDLKASYERAQARYPKLTREQWGKLVLRVD